ncbi:hypothetical protein JIN85_07175 [Luteolibacter pohnpeiensis]|uniref:DUF4129 domain-containing protein n=1 Tax=Luteolibacter pohnpeiensis TaxID=454153 RepID=A0A934SA85_9BACT|nr:hypothetical protein [Luteolibacter pohnpeiensis]MBK1882189.1 hypothetical protein [Luteolibacter pohnpeiensis]
MRLDEVTAEIRPRSDWEAVDLGFAMVRRHFWRCLILWWMALGIPIAVLGWLLWDHPALYLALIWWFKPAGSRMVLFELSRRLFGEKPSWKSIWREVPRVWVRRLFFRFGFGRLSPWLPITLAVDDLEGLRGKHYKMRARQLSRRGDGAVTWIFLSADLATAWFAIGLIGLGAIMLPSGQDAPWTEAMQSWSSDEPFVIPLLVMRTVAFATILSMSLVDLFLTGAGFGIYVNNRTWIEGWDVELAFKRLGQRLGKVAAGAAVLFFFILPAISSARPQSMTVGNPPPAEVIREIKSNPDFEVHTITRKIPKEEPKKSSTRRSWLEDIFGSIPPEIIPLFLYSLLGLVICFLAWVIWRFRHAFIYRGGIASTSATVPSARVVMGMEVTPESLPDDIPAAVMALWQRGLRQEALGLLYRGAISKVMVLAHVEIQESDTEGDCLERVRHAGAVAHPDYFGSLTHTWMRMAYAGTAPADLEVGTLCSSWPFQALPERRRA